MLNTHLLLTWRFLIPALKVVSRDDPFFKKRHPTCFIVTVLPDTLHGRGCHCHNESTFFSTKIMFCTELFLEFLEFAER